MIIVCPRCGLLYTVEAADFAHDPRTVRCSGCEWEWLQSSAEALPDDDEALQLLALRVNGSVKREPSPPSAARTLRRPAVSRPLAANVAPAAAAPVAAAAAPGAVKEEQPAAERVAPPTPEEESEEPFDEGLAVVPDEPAPPLAVAEVEPQPAVGQQIRDDDEAEPEPAGQVVAAKALNSRAAADDHLATPAPAKDVSDTSGKIRRYKRPPAAALAGGAIAATLLVAAGLLSATRGPIIATFPGAAGVYRAVGFSVPLNFAEGLEIRDVSSSRSWGDDGQVLTVEGDLANIAGQARNLPMVRVVLVDGSDAEVQEVVVPPPSESLPVGETIRFEAHISHPAETAKRIKVSLAPPQEPS